MNPSLIELCFIGPVLGYVLLLVFGVIPSPARTPMQQDAFRKLQKWRWLIVAGTILTVVLAVFDRL